MMIDESFMKNKRSNIELLQDLAHGVFMLAVGIGVIIALVSLFAAIGPIAIIPAVVLGLPTLSLVMHGSIKTLYSSARILGRGINKIYNYVSKKIDDYKAAKEETIKVQMISPKKTSKAMIFKEVNTSDQEQERVYKISQQPNDVQSRSCSIVKLISNKFSLFRSEEPSEQVVKLDVSQRRYSTGR